MQIEIIRLAVATDIPGVSAMMATPAALPAFDSEYKVRTPTRAQHTYILGPYTLE
jgi:hypothetical protein